MRIWNEANHRTWPTVIPVRFTPSRGCTPLCAGPGLWAVVSELDMSCSLVWELNIPAVCSRCSRPPHTSCLPAVLWATRLHACQPDWLFLCCSAHHGFPAWSASVSCHHKPACHFTNLHRTVVWRSLRFSLSNTLSWWQFQVKEEFGTSA